ncbi:MAG TPA: phosphoesterase [Telmatospirillum sp.]|nr:phosphoesterase [Telmatospirillum sp.]
MKRFGLLAFLFVAILVSPPSIAAERKPLLTGDLLPTGAWITPLAAPGADLQALDPDLPGNPQFRADHAVAMAQSPDGKTLLLLTSGFNLTYGPAGKIAEQSNEYIFVYDIEGDIPRKRQVLTLPNSFLGLAWAPDGQRFFVSGGIDDRVAVFTRRDASFEPDGAYALGHKAGVGRGVKPMAAGLAVDPLSRRLLVANYENDSVTLIDLAQRRQLAERDLRPGKIDATQSGIAGGEYPIQIRWQSSRKAYVSSQRDREIVVLAIDGTAITVQSRIKTSGQPTAMDINRDGSRLFAVLDNSDSVVAIDTATDSIIEEIPTVAPATLFKNSEELRGASPNQLALSPDQRSLLVTNGGTNSLAVIALGPVAGNLPVPAKNKADDDDDDDDAPAAANGAAPPKSRVVGLIPTGWYPSAVAIRADGRRIFVANAKSPAGPNAGGCRDTLATTETHSPCRANNRYIWQLEKAGLMSLPPPKPAALAQLTWQVAANNHFPGFADHGHNQQVMDAVRQRIKHIIYVIKENRAFDQVLGDLEMGNGDPRLVLFPASLSPNHHALARRFVTLDAFFASGEVSNSGWLWSTSARTTDFTEKAAPILYAGRGLTYDWEGVNRGVNVGLASQRDRKEANPDNPDDADLLPGTADIAAPDGPHGETGAGALWDSAARAGLSLRNYGFYVDLERTTTDGPHAVPLLRQPAADGVTVAMPTKAALMGNTDPYYRGFDLRLPDFWRIREWEREFDGFIAKGSLPQLMLVRLPNDHFGNFANAIDGVNTVELQMADNDYALGRLVERVAGSPFKDDTLILSVEDDAQGGADHVDAHRTLAFAAGPTVRQGVVISTPYNTVNLLRTIEDILGLSPMGLNDGLAEPMADLFDPASTGWDYQAQVPPLLRRSQLPLPAGGPSEATADCFAAPGHDAAYWESVMRGQNFMVEDHLDTERFNAALWTGMKGGQIPPANRNGADLSGDRAALLAAARAACGSK